MNIILASASPRRYELLKGLGYEVRTLHPDVEEIDGQSGKTPQEIAKINAELKAEKIYSTTALNDDEIIIAADTVVSLDSTILGKPENIEHARSMLESLCGRTHEVSTGYCLITKGGEKFSDVLCSEVCFRRFSKEELEAYLTTKESLGKAGSYGVQGAAAGLIASIHGSISNIIGLPVEEVLFHARRLLEHA